MAKARVIALYLPQFYPVKENDEIWGAGFTEWTNVAGARPLYRNHYQPQLPGELGFYDLRLSETREAQAKLAKEHGIEGFCYWHYWFGDGRRVLDRPFKEVLESGEPNFPFCLAWANHNWTTRTWQKVNHFTKDDVFIEQKYPGDEDYIRHFYEVLPAFRDSRYITVDEKPLFMIFAPEDIPDVTHFIELWRQLAKENGLLGIHFVARLSSVPKLGFDNIKIKDLSYERYTKFLSLGFDAINSDTQRYAEAKASGFVKKAIGGVLRKYIGNYYPQKYSYEKIMKYFNLESERLETVYPQILPRLDRTPRSGKDARIYEGSSPALFGKAIEKVLELVEKKSCEHKIVFLQAWNEWGEGNYIEPDRKYGRAYLEILRDKVLD